MAERQTLHGVDRPGACGAAKWQASGREARRCNRAGQLFWRVMVHGLDYVERGLKEYAARAAHSEQYVLRKLAHKHGLSLVPQNNNLETVPG